MSHMPSSWHWLRTRLHLVEKRTSAKNSVQRPLEKYNVPEVRRLPAEARLPASPYREPARSVYIVLKEQVNFNHTFKAQPLSKRKASKWPPQANPAI
ncbi:MAG: hypothetical protein BMS9Abin29_2407 [Gemmatimonadota bacterium]|nr:MAG: hypothetical protein BMS9Abin29_2407 [Gemmatimonadota bacterium]